MPHTSSKPLLLVIVGAGALALLVGLVRSASRDGSRPRSNGTVEAWRPEEPVSLRVPVVPLSNEAPASEPVSSATRAHPAVTSRNSGEQRRELARVAGIVLRPEGDPASEARVLLGKQQARCGADGRFELVLTDDASAADLLAFEPGYEPALRAAFGANLVAGSTPELRLVLGPSTLSLSGSVTDHEHHPLKGWTVELDGIDPLAASGLRERVRTDAAGHFLLTDVPTGIHIVRAFQERRELAFRSPPIGAGEEGLVILAEPSE